MVSVGLFQMGDCGLIRFFKMLKKLEILPILVGCRGRSVSASWLGQEYPTLRPFRAAGRRSDSDWSAQMLWTAEAVEDLKRLALEGKSASHISAALGVGSRNAVIGKASRIGIKLNGGGRAAGRGGMKARAGQPRWATAHYPRPHADDHGSSSALARDLPDLAGGRQGGRKWLWRSRGRRDATAAVRGDS